MKLSADTQLQGTVWSGSQDTGEIISPGLGSELWRYILVGKLALTEVGLLLTGHHPNYITSCVKFSCSVYLVG